MKQHHKHGTYVSKFPLTLLYLLISLSSSNIQYSCGFSTTTTTTTSFLPTRSRFKDYYKPLHTKSIRSTSKTSPVSSKSALFSTTSSSPQEQQQQQQQEPINTQVLILGSGPAARCLASLLHSSSITTTLADANADLPWPPNYGVWKDEWDAITSLYSSFNVTGLAESTIDTEWQVTDCYFGGSFGIPTKERFRVDRPYCRIDKDALRDKLTNGYEILKANHASEGIGLNMYAPMGSLIHHTDGSMIRLVKKSKEEVVVNAKLIVDCTGHETKLVLKDRRTPSRDPGYQIAYGVLMEVEEDEKDDDKSTTIGPYDKAAMTLFDYRTDHIPPAQSKAAETAPTFMYCMPLGKNRIFFEETSLVARPALSFMACKERCFQRLDHLGIQMKTMEEEEFCYIPMGGPLPEKNQRVIGFGGANAMVHPSTGYHLCRAMMGAGDVANVLKRELLLESNEDFNPDRAAARAYHAIWSPSNVRQRNFAVFGGEFLMKQDVEGLRGFFDGFFRLPVELWGGFLAGWPGLPNNIHHETWYGRLWFGLYFVSRLPFKVGLDMLLSIIAYTVTDWDALPQSVTPFLGEPESYEYEKAMPRSSVGDVAAKLEAKKMIMESKVTEDLPVAFGEKERMGEGVSGEGDGTGKTDGIIVVGKILELEEDGESEKVDKPGKVDETAKVEKAAKEDKLAEAPEAGKTVAVKGNATLDESFQ